MNYKLNSIVQLKKNHPCGNNEFQIIRVGMEIKLRCINDNAIITLKRRDFEKRLTTVVKL